MPASKDPERSPQTEAMEKLLELMTDDAAARYAAIAQARSREEYLERIDDFNTLGARQLNRADEGTAETLEHETLASRQIGFDLSLPMGRTLRVTRAANGVVTLSDASIN